VKHIFISPHFDDAIGSCGAAISRLRRCEEAVIVYTVFAGASSPPFSDLAVELHAQWGCGDSPVPARAEEDAWACRALDCIQQLGDVPEALYRKSGQGTFLYPDEGALFGPSAPEDADLHLRISQDLAREFLKADVCFYAPLGAGRHVDHVITFRAGLEWLQQGYPISFYRDFYYADCDCPHLAEREFQISPQPSSALDLERKLRAFSCYKSQIPMLFKDSARALAYFERREQESQNQKPFEETFWKLMTPSPRLNSVALESVPNRERRGPSSFDPA
jgi:LmbE family N-acetylglucosaminyl deacetylase